MGCGSGFGSRVDRRTSSPPNWIPMLIFPHPPNNPTQSNNHPTDHSSHPLSSSAEIAHRHGALLPCPAARRARPAAPQGQRWRPRAARVCAYRVYALPRSPRARRRYSQLGLWVGIRTVAERRDCRLVDWCVGRDVVVVLTAETAVTAVLVYNIFEAAYRVQHPSAAPPTPAGLKLVPVLKSSPLVSASREGVYEAYNGGIRMCATRTREQDQCTSWMDWPAGLGDSTSWRSSISSPASTSALLLHVGPAHTRHGATRPRPTSARAPPRHTLPPAPRRSPPSPRASTSPRRRATRHRAPRP